MGHHGNRISRYYLNGWVYTGYGADTNFHLWEIVHQGRNDNNDKLRFLRMVFKSPKIVIPVLVGILSSTNLIRGMGNIIGNIKMSSC